MTRELQGRHVLTALLGFFGVIFAVNGYFLVSALRTHTGVVSVEPYRKGLAYNERIAASDAQAALGWTAVVNAARDGAVDVSITGDDGRPVSGLRLTGMIGRPSTARSDMRLAFAEAGPGLYRATAGQLADGNWMIDLEAFRGTDEDPQFRARRRLWLKQ